MISNVLAVRNRLVGWLGLTLLAFIATVFLGQGVAFANVLTPLAQPVGLNVNPKAQNPFEPALIPALAARAQQSPAAAPAIKVTASPTQISPPVDEHWLAELIHGEALVQPLAWATMDGRPRVSPTRPAEPTERARVLEAFGRSPLHFEPNRGQAAEPVKFLARAPGYQLYLTPAEAVLALRGAQPATVRMHLVGEGVNSQPVVEALDALPGRSHYYLGNDPHRWQTDVPHFAKVRYAQVYPGVDWVLYGNPRQLEYDFVVAPGVDPTQIALTFAGADETRIAANGELVVAVAGREVLHSAPTLYQMVNGERRRVEGRYVLREAADAAPVVGFEVAAYDPKRPLVIDPVVYFTYVGGAPDDNTGIGGDDLGLSVAVDSTGNAYITGHTSTNNANIADASKDFPISANAITGVFSGGTDVFVTRMDSAGTIIYSTYFGGSGYESGYGIAVDSVGNAYITGYTNSDDFPNPTRSTAESVNTGNPVTITTASPLPDGKQGTAFPQTLVANGGTAPYTWTLDSPQTNLPPSLTLSTGGVLSGTPTINDVGTWNFIVRVADNSDPTQNVARKTFTLTILVKDILQGAQDAFVAKINASGTLAYSRYLGGTGNEAGHGIAVNTSGQAYVTGYTTSANFPGGAAADAEDAFVVQLDAAGSVLLYSSLTNFAGNDRGQGIVLDASGTDAYITGFRTNDAANEAAFIAKLDNTGAISYSASLDSPAGNERGLAIARDDATGVYITGYTNSSSGIATVGAYDTTFNGPAASQDAFAAKYTDTRAAFTLVYATYLGGYSNDVGYGIVVDSFGQAYVAGETYSPDFPMVSADDSVQSKGEAFLSRLNAAGTQLTYSSFWGGAENDSGRGLAKDFANDVYLVGYTNSPKDGFSLGPIKPYRDYSGGADAFVTKFSIPVANTDYSLTVNFQGSGSGLVTSIPEGIGQTADCKITNGVLDPPSADCNASYPTGTVVTLTAVAEANSRFIGWSGACTGTSTCQVTMTQAQSVNANFAPLRTLTVTKTGSGSGTVTSSPAGIDCGADCSEGYPQNAQVVLTATPAAGAAFTDWSGGVCSGTASTCTFIMDTDKTVSANFKVPEFALTVLKTGTGTGTVASNPDGINCGADCTKNYALGTVVTLTATPNAGFAFSNWGGACTGTSTTCLVTMDQAKEVTANFTVNYLLTVTKDGTGTGTVTAEGGGINCGSDCTESYPANTVLNLAAEASAGSTFAGWSGACTGLGTCVVTMTAAQNVKATFNLGEANLPDLVVSTLASPAPGQTNSSSALTFSLNVTNQGSAAAGSFGVGLYLSADQTIDPATDGEIDECLLMNLNVGATSPVCTKTITLPTIFTAGSYSSLGAYADPENLIAESTETNNSRATAIATVTYNRNPLTVTKAGTGGGTVISAPAGIVCGSACTAALLSTSVDTATLTLTAAPNTGSTFTGWSGGCSGAEDCVVTMNAAKTVTATFAASTCPASSGDVNGDGSVNALDAVAVTNHILGIQTSPNTDVNCDGGVNALDLVFVINKVLGL